MYTHLYRNTCIYASLHISSWALHSAYARVVGLGITSHSSAKNRHCLLGVNYMRCLQHARTSISSMNDWRGLVHRVLKIFSPWCYLRLGRITIIIVKSLCYSKDVRGAIWHRWREENKARWGFFRRILNRRQGKQRTHWTGSQQEEMPPKMGPSAPSQRALLLTPSGVWVPASSGGLEDFARFLSASFICGASQTSEHLVL